MSGAPLWTAAQAAAATGGRNTADWRAGGVSIDSRSLARGDLFVALAGPNFDGHDFIGKAFEAGAAAAVSHRTEPADAAGRPLLLVEDTMAALWRLGATARGRSRARFIGVTGSVGKTSTKEALAHCLRAQATTAASAGSLNNHWGLPLSLARLPLDAAFGVFELGMNHAGEIRELSGLLRPHVALVTNVEAAHIGHFASLEAIADAKAEIFESVEPDGAAVLNRDNPHFERLAATARAAGVERIVGFGRDPAAEVRAVEAVPEGAGSRVRAQILGRPLDYVVALPGSHWVANSLAVLAAVAAAGGDVARAAAEFARIAPAKGRGERHRMALRQGDFELIDDSYNANPASMRAAFEVLARAEPGPEGRRIAVLGDMLELGARSAELHRGLAAALDDFGIDLVFTCGPEMDALADALPPARRGGHAADSRTLAPLVAAGVRSGDVLLVKGSAGSRMGRVIETLNDMARTLPRAANGD